MDLAQQMRRHVFEPHPFKVKGDTVIEPVSFFVHGKVFPARRRATPLQEDSTGSNPED